jgi:predicted GTPase
MSKNLRERAESTAKEVQEILGISTDDYPKKVVDAIEHAIIRALIEERHRCADMARDSMAEDAQRAQDVGEKIRAVNSVLITNLNSMR